MKLKKFMSIVTAIALTGGCMAGCSTQTVATVPAETGKETAAVTNAETAAETNAETAGNEDQLSIPDTPITIEYWDHITENPEKGIIEAAIGRFEKAYPNVKVNVTHTQNDSYKEKLVVAMSSGQCPDMYSHWGGGPMNEYIESGYAQDITDLYKQYCKIPFLQAAVEQSSYNGKLYAIPFRSINGSGFFYNKDIFAKNNIEIPQTIDELEADCDKLKEAGYIPLALANANKWTGSMYYMYLVARKSGLKEFNAAVDGTGSFTSEAFKYAGEKIQDWVKKGYFPEGVNSLNADDGQDKQLIYTEQAAMMLEGSWMTADMPSDDKDFYSSKIGFFPFPKNSESDADQSIMVGTSIGNGYSFNCKEDKLKACFILATQFINDQEYIDALTAAGKIPPIKGVETKITDPVVKQVWEAFSKASAVQLWYDQYLPPMVAEKHKDTCQEIFGLTMTPDQADQELETAMKTYIDSKKK